jgi:hypothetical protein
MKKYLPAIPYLELPDPDSPERTSSIKSLERK